MRMIECSGIAALWVLGTACFSEGTQTICDEPSCDDDDGDDDGTSGASVTMTATATTPGTSTSITDPSDPSVTASDPTHDDTTDTPADSGTAPDSSSDDDAGSDASTTTGDPTDDTTGGPAPVCGNSVIEADEECDDGNDAPFDGCDLCLDAAVLQWQFAADHEGGDDEVTSLAADGNAVIVGGMVTSLLSGVDAVWLRVDDGSIAPPAWFHVADLPGSNRLWDVARNADVCAIGGVVETVQRTPLVSANLVSCGNGSAGMGMAIEIPEGPGPEDLRSMTLRGDNGVVLGGWRMHGGTPRGWIAQFDASGQPDGVDWLDDPGLFGAESRVHALFPADGELFVAGTALQGGANRGFAGALSTLAIAPLTFGVDADASEAAGVVANAENIVVAGWTTDGADRSALVQSFPLRGGAPIGWTLDLDDDDRALGIALRPGGVAVTGFTGTDTADRDLFVVWLDDALQEEFRVVFDGAGHGSDIGRSIVTDGDEVIVGGHVTVDDHTDLLVQRWSPPA